MAKDSNKLYKQLVWKYRRNYFIRASLVICGLDMFVLRYQEYTISGIKTGFGKGLHALSTSRTFNEFIYNLSIILAASAIAGALLSLLFWPLAKKKAQLETLQQLTGKKKRGGKSKRTNGSSTKDNEPDEDGSI